MTCDETSREKKGTVTYLLLVIEQNVMRLPGRKKVLLLTCCWLCDEIYWTAVEMKGTITYKLLVIKWDDMRLSDRKVKGIITHLL